MDQKCCRADLANLVNEAALLAGRSSKEVVEKIDFTNAVERSIAVCATSLSKLVKMCICQMSRAVNVTLYS
jgi:ATP-dependent Zn protease